MQKKKVNITQIYYFNNMQISYEYLLPVFLHFYNCLKYVYKKINFIKI